MRFFTILLLAACIITEAFGLTYPVVDTGQTTAYGDNTGQDAHYLANPPSFRDNGDGTVSDLVTGLMWTQDPGEKMTHAQAVSNAGTCRIGGYEDWRLPTMKELYSLINFNGEDPGTRSASTADLKPFIDDSVFAFRYGDPAKDERIIDSQFATSTLYVGTTMGGNETMFGVNFADGRIKGYPVKNQRGEKTFHVLYVRGKTGYGENDFEDNGNGTITDKATNLTWMKTDSGKGMDWPTALEYAEGVEFAGFSDWRLPDAKELHSIVDYTRSPDTTGSAAIDPVFESTEISNEGGEEDFAQYWTSTTHLSTRGSGAGVYIAFGRSLGWMEDRRTGKKRLLDVHGAGSQRADPKTGEASRYPEGRGPQGDVVRIENMVRLVRGGGVETVEPEVEPNRTTTRNTPPGNRSGRHQGQANSQADRIFTRFDTDKDGEISKAEFKGPERRFDMLDQDGNGIITRQEAAAAPPPPNRDERRRREGDSRPFEAAVELPAQDSPSPAVVTSDKPNFIFIYADDMGWTGTSVEMIEGNPESRSDFYQTPNLEKLASRGVVFSQAYSPGPMCTPSRAAVLTGMTPAELHLTTPGAGRTDGSRKLLTPRPATSLPDEIPTIGSILKAKGYATALLGKWHIGRDDNAGQHGFDHHDGSTENNSRGTITDPQEIFSLTERGIRFMEENVKAGKPFFLQLSHYAVHYPAQSRPESVARFENVSSGKIHQDAELAGMTWDLDESIGRIFDVMEKLGIESHTYVVFMSDNGAPGNRRRPNNSPLLAGKGTLYEGGIRVPLIIAGPGLKTGYSAVPVSGTDLFATFASWSGAAAKTRESDDLTPLLQGEPEQFASDRDLFFHYPHYGRGQFQTPQTALILGEWKLLKDWETDSYKLFNLVSDPGERNSLSDKETELLKHLMTAMDKRLEETTAQLPSRNPDYR